MKILTTEQIRHLDAFTIKHEPISSEALMERAAGVFFEKLCAGLAESNEVTVFCGTGNNGGDGFVIARRLMEYLIPVRVVLVPFGEMSVDCKIQYDKIKTHVHTFSEFTDWEWNDQSVIVDALLGIGSNRKPEGILQAAIQCINDSGVPVMAVDMPSGLSADDLPTHQVIVRATKTWTFHVPKLTFFLPETAHLAGEWEVLDIGLDKNETNNLHEAYHLLTKEEVDKLIPARKRFSHKGSYGHGLLIAGSEGKMGAAVLSSRAAMRSGLGLLSVYTIHSGRTVLPVAIPEAMGIFDESDKTITGNQLPDPADYSAMAVGPGLGVHEGTGKALQAVMQSGKPLVLDADALNYLSQTPELINQLHKNCLLTPHPKEFERLTEPSENSLHRLKLAKDLAIRSTSTVVLKDAITIIALSDGTIWFNTTGNPGMATGGSGDVLTGIILGLLTQGFSPENAARIGVFHHGFAGDHAALKRGQRALLAGDLTEHLRIE